MEETVTLEECPTDPFTISKPQNQEIGEFYAIQKWGTTDFESSKL